MPPPNRGDAGRSGDNGTTHRPAPAARSAAAGEPTAARRPVTGRGRASVDSVEALDGGLPGDDGEIEVRPLATLDEYRACVALQRATWGESFSDVVPLSLLKVSQRIGGIAAGAFDERGTLLGFVFGMTGIGDGGEVVHWSDMLAVLPGHRNAGLGRRLKEYQRETLRALGVRTIYWTFDPLVARNAHLNLNKLGARVAEYVPDMYGATDSPLHRGMGTDRFIAAWAVDGHEVERSASRAAPRGAPVGAKGGRSDFDPDRLVNPEAAGEPATLALQAARRGESPVYVQIPSDIRQVQQTSLAGAAAWRDNTRAAFLALQELGYEVVGFERDDQAGPCRYVLAPSAPTVERSPAPETPGSTP